MSAEQNDDRIALITGSSAGIGEAIARRLHQDGVSLLIHGLLPGETEAVSNDLNRKRPGSALALAADLADPAVPRRLVDAVLERFGRLDILVNNAAFTGRSNLETTDTAFFDQMMAVNVRAPLLLCQAALPHFRSRGGGRILNIGSINGYCGEANLLAYSISKGALMTLSRNLADAHGREGIRVHHFNLGWTLTPNEYALKRREGLPDDWPERIGPVHAPSGRLLKPEEIAHFAAAFLSEAGWAVNGSVVELEQYPVIGRNPQKVAE